MRRLRLLRWWFSVRQLQTELRDALRLGRQAQIERDHASAIVKAQRQVVTELSQHERDLLVENERLKTRWLAADDQRRAEAAAADRYAHQLCRAGLVPDPERHAIREDG